MSPKLIIFCNSLLVGKMPVASTQEDKIIHNKYIELTWLENVKKMNMLFSDRLICNVCNVKGQYWELN